jgi:hypothetical protein
MIEPTNVGAHPSSYLSLVFHQFNKKCIFGMRGVACTAAGNTNWRERLSTVDLLIKGAGFAKKLIIFAISKAADLNLLVQGG